MASKAGSDLRPVPRNTLFYSVLILAYNEEKNILPAGPAPPQKADATRDQGK